MAEGYIYITSREFLMHLNTYFRSKSGSYLTIYSGVTPTYVISVWPFEMGRTH